MNYIKIILLLCASQASLSCMEHSRDNYRIAIVHQVKLRPSRELFEDYLRNQKARLSHTCVSVKEEYLLTRKISQHLNLRLDRICEPKWHLFWASLISYVKAYNRLPSWINLEKIFTEKEIFDLCAITQSVDLGSFLEESLLEVAQLLAKEKL